MYLGVLGQHVREHPGGHPRDPGLGQHQSEPLDEPQQLLALRPVTGGVVLLLLAGAGLGLGAAAGSGDADYLWRVPGAMVAYAPARVAAGLAGFRRRDIEAT